jgi:serine/threonine protein kinase
MGEVYRALDPALERELVLKILSNEAVYRAELLERFIREAQAASALNRPDLVPSTRSVKLKADTPSPWSSSADTHSPLVPLHGVATLWSMLSVQLPGCRIWLHSP